MGLKRPRKILEEFCTNRVPVSLTNGQIKINKINNKLEVMFRSDTKMEESNALFKCRTPAHLAEKELNEKSFTKRRT